MPLVSFDYNDFINILGYKISKEDLIERLPMIGADFDSVDGDEISIEFFPNRPDLVSVEGIARACRTFFGFERGLKKYVSVESDVVLRVDPSVKSVRPFVTTALIKNVVMSDELIKSLMELQEKLHLGLGRDRRKVAIGVHNYEPVTPPFTYKAVDPDSVQFVPLAKDDFMTMSEILLKHEKGVDYAHLLEGFDKHSLIVDANNNVLSYPPIINGRLTEVTPFTSEIFIDVTGTDLKAINYALNIVTTSLAERGAQLYTTTVVDGDATYHPPDLNPSNQTISKTYTNRILGTSLNLKDVVGCLEKMGYNAKEKDKENIIVEIPAWRADILHEIDIVEDVAIGFGFDCFDTDFPKALTFGRTLPSYEYIQSLRSIMIGLGFNEVTTFTISNEKDEFTHFGLPKGSMVAIANPIGEEYSGLRTSLLPSMLKLLRENRHHPLPQNVFEVGIVVDEHAKNQYHLAAVKIDAKANFTLSNSLTEAVLRDIGVEYTYGECNHPGFIPGRCAAVMVKNKQIGFFGELHPQTIQNFELEHPMIALELQLSFL